MTEVFFQQLQVLALYLALPVQHPVIDQSGYPLISEALRNSTCRGPRHLKLRLNVCASSPFSQLQYD